VESVPTVIVARTDALDADLLASDVDEADREFATGERTEEGFLGSTRAWTRRSPAARVRAACRFALVRDQGARPR
jgi:isocitrate lyase